jgi:2-isopropylmalate synthase
MHPQVGKRIYDLADELGRELSLDEIREAFLREFVNVSSPLDVTDYELVHHAGERGQVKCTTTIVLDGKSRDIEGTGNGPINAFVRALESIGLKNFKVTDYRSHAVRGGSDANAAAYVQVQHEDGRLLWGAGVDPSIEMAGLKALVTAWNLLQKES